MIIPSGFAQANLRWSGSAAPQGAEVTLGLDIDLYGSSPTTAAQQVGDLFMAQAIDNFITQNLTLDEVEVKFGPNSTGPSGLYLVNGAMTGPASNSPPQVAWLVRKVTGFGGRTGRGRMFLPGVPEGYVDNDGSVVGANASLLTDEPEAWRIALAGVGLIPTLLHGPNSPVSSPIPITEFVVDPRTATQRRRLRG